MKHDTGTFLEERNRLEQQVENGKPQPKETPQSLPLLKIKLIPEVFQHRKHVPWKSEPHIKTLAQAIQNNQLLEPVTVWWSGKHWICIDGHHRLAAYKSIHYDYQDIPVIVFEGSVDEAIKKAALGNTKDKLQMTSQEKIEAAWRLTIASKTFSKVDVTEATGVSDGTVASMRRVKRILLEQDPERDLSELLWISAMALAKGKTLEIVNLDEKLEKEAEKLAAILAKNLPPQTRKAPEVFARAIEIYDSRMADALSEYWNNHEDVEMEF